MSMIQLRTAGPEDVEALIPRMLLFNAGEDIAMTEERLRPALLGLLGDRGIGRVFLVEREGGVIGYVVMTFGFDLEFGGRDAWITEVWLDVAHRGLGLGLPIMQGVEAEAARLGVGALHLMVRPENAPAVALYARAGYEPPPRITLTRVVGGGDAEGAGVNRHSS